MRKLLTFPFNLVCLILALFGVVLIRSKEFAVGLERKLDVFEEKKKKKQKVRNK